MKCKIISVITGVILLVLPHAVRSAEFYFGTQSREVGEGRLVETGVLLNTDGETINAIEGIVRYPSDRLEVVEMRDGGSLLSFWVERPHLQGEGKVAFSGVVPGGYSGSRGYLFSMIMRAEAGGEAVITTNNESVLLHDGEGTAAALRRSPLTLQIRETGIVPEFVPPPDTEPPEAFVPEIAQDPNVAEGKWFVAFVAQDKGSGIDYYAIHESRRMKTRIATKEWVVGESPYLLQDQKLRSHVFVKAVDKAQNERVAVVPPRFPLPWWANFRIWGILIGSGVIVYLVWRTIWRITRPKY